MSEGHRHSLRRLQWQVFIAITFGYAFFYVCRLSFNVVKKPLIDAGLFDPSQLGMIGSALFFAYAAGRLFNGLLVDHADIRRFMAIGLLASALIDLLLAACRRSGSSCRCGAPTAGSSRWVRRRRWWRSRAGFRSSDAAPSTKRSHGW